jgi:membrane protein YdbS with pleckstrin-like domain
MQLFTSWRLLLVKGANRKLIVLALLIFVAAVYAVATLEEDAASDTVAAAFVQTRQTAHLSNLKRMRRKVFREQVCKDDMRFASGVIENVVYQTVD